MKLSILMPVYNEERSILEAVKAALGVSYPCPVELVVVNDGSKDATGQLLATIDDDRVVVCTHGMNRGKSAAIRTAAAQATGDYIIVLDADLEYDPEDIPKLLRPVQDGAAVVVYGNRTFGSHSAYSYWYVLGNRAITTVANVLFNSYIGDLETCFKLMPLGLYRSLDIRSKNFGIEAEITGKLLRRGLRPFEVGITYRARSRAEGKKITWRDGLQAVAILARERSRSVPPAR